MEQPESLWIARYCDALASTGAHDAVAYSQAAAELRRLHAENEDAHAVGVQQERDIIALESQRDELLAALKEYDSAFTEFDPPSKASRHRMRMATINARAAIAKAEGK